MVTSLEKRDRRSHAVKSQLRMRCLTFNYNISGSDLFIDHRRIMSGLKLFVDRMSPVCRAVLLLLKANNVPYEEVFVDLSKGEERQLPGSIHEGRPCIDLPMCCDRRGGHERAAGSHQSK